MALQNTARARQHSSNRLIIVILLILVLIGGAGYLLLGKPNTTLLQEQKRPAGYVAIPIMSQNINLGSKINSTNTILTYMKPEEVPIDAIISMKQFNGRLATRNLSAGDYLRETDVSAQGAHSGYSGITRIGKRTVALPQAIFPDKDALRVGDRIDLLSIGTPSGFNPSATPLGKSLADSSVTLQGGGTQPGDPNSAARQRARARNSSNGTTVANATTATLIAENAEVMSTNNKLVILQMEPQDAHVTTLAMASGAFMRAVFRPFNDSTRLTPNKELTATTRLPKPSLDPDAIVVFNAGERSNQRPISNMYADDTEMKVSEEENTPLIQDLNF